MRRSYDERGDTLIELLAAVVILAICGVGILGALATSISGSSTHRIDATAQFVVDNAAEYVKKQGFQPNCGPLPLPPPAQVGLPGGWTLQIGDAANGLQADDIGGGPCVPSGATATVLQSYPVKVTGPGGISRAVNVVVRNQS